MSAPLRFGNLAWLLGGLALAAAPHAGRLPAWITTIALIMLGWRAYLAWSGNPLPRKWLLVAFVGACLLGVYITFSTIFGRDAGVSLLIVFLGLKLMEMKSYRDVYVVMFLAYFIALTNFFYSQTIPTATLMTVTVLMITASLVSFQAPSRRHVDNLKTGGMLLAQAAPLMLLLFFLFPRVQGPLWGLPQDAYSGVTGLSDSMTPGNISQLSQSDAVAFRAKFEGAMPPRRQLYWRGPVFWNYDGRTWRPGNVRMRGPYRFEGIEPHYDYAITLEPHNRNWLFALELAATIPPRARVTADYQLLSIPPVRSRMRYEMRSYPNYKPLDTDNSEDLDAALALPEGLNPRTLELGRRWERETKGDAEAIVARGLELFRNGGFRYTLEPPLLTTPHTVDEFIFDSKLGFCEHYSGAFAVLMRSAGVPARIVTGYLGGDVNPVDEQLIVRQSDAHAWVEVWTDAGGWKRVDPTAVVVPVRVESGIAQAVPAGQPVPFMVRTDRLWLLKMRYNIEAMAHKWNIWVLGYNPDRQREMLSFIGMDAASWQSLALALFWGIAGMVAVLALWLLRRLRLDDPVQRQWRRFCDKLGRAGLARAASEGPLDFAARAATRFPQQAALVRDIGSLYIDLRYGRHADRGGISRLGRLIRNFHP
jgi:transglutaminase-like putative cysteine protease